MARRVVDVGAVLAELKTVLVGGLPKQVSLDVDAEPQSTVMADKAALTHVLMNLLTNAGDALHGAAGNITARVRRVRRPDGRWDGAFGATVTPGDWVMIEVEDTGVGMDPATKARAFEPFFSTKSTGHGLGLAACLGIVSSHAGAVAVDSSPGEGSRFSILLPGATHEQCVPTVERVTVTSSPCRVLVIDDELVVRTQLRRSLALRGYSVTEVEGGQAGIAAFEQYGADLVIVDMTMPDMDGAHVIQQIRQRDPAVPIVLASGYSVVGAERGLDPASFQSFLRKPFSISELMAAIEQARAGR
jgi:CheY-like chemotaxis protein